ncbi:FG-GAP repeat domain-containing protein [Streptomyces sp. NPDC089424]|uniref:FG-GAP repeat domain-containing protein n=1 Tax=Streptomyces sp. NPDC089424 TaxID=3365917 RepID=UPI00382ED07B
MARHGFTRLRLVAACAVLAGGLTPLLPGTAVADTPQETVVPATLRSTYLGATLQITGSGADGAGAQGVFHTLEGSGLVWTRYADGRSVKVVHPTGYSRFRPVGDVIAYIYADHHVDLWNAADGTTRTVRVPDDMEMGSLTAYDDVVVAERRTQEEDGTTRRETHLLSPEPDGSTRDMTVTGLPEEYTMARPLGRYGETVLFRAGLTGTWESMVVEVDTTTGRVRSWTAPSADPYLKVRITEDHLVLYNPSDPTVLVHDRADLAADPVRVTLRDGGMNPTQELTVVGDWLVQGSYARPIAGGPEVTLFTSSSPGIATASDGTSVVIGRTGTDDWGVQRIQPGPDGRPVVTQIKSLGKPSFAIQGLSLDQGRLVVTDYGTSSGATGTRVARTRTVAPTGTPVFGSAAPLTDSSVVVGRCPVDDDACAPVRASADGNIAWLEHRSAEQDVIRVAGPSGPWQRTVPAGGRITDVSGDYLIHRTATEQTVYWIGDDGAPELIRTPVAAALSGSVLWSAGATPGSVTAYDLVTGRTTETLTTDAGCTPDELQALGRFLYWACDGRAGVFDRTANKSVPVPTGEAELGDGYVVTHDRAAGKLTLTTVADGPPVSRVIGDLPDTGVSQRDVRWTVDEAGGNAAYVDAQERVHLVPSGVPQQPLRLLRPARNATSVQAREVDAVLDPVTTLQLSKPAAGWRLTVRDKVTGRTVDVHERERESVRGELTVGWDGNVATGGRLPNGTYDWTLTVNPADGVGGPLETRGTVRLYDGSPVRHDHMGPSGIVDGVGDLLSLSSSGGLTFHQGTGRGGFTEKLTGTGWPTSVKAVPVGDMDGDRCNDVLVKYSGGTVRLYKPDCGAPLKPSTSYTTIATGTGWNQYNVLTSPGDVNKDGRPDLIARNTATGGVYLYKGTSTGTFAPRVKLYDNWKTYKKVVGAGDLNGDGIGDLVAQDTTNALYRYFGTGKGTFASRVKLSPAWGVNYNVVVGAGDVTGDGAADLIARDTTGALYRIPGTGKGSFGTRARISTGWQDYKGLF